MNEIDPNRRNRRRIGALAVTAVLGLAAVGCGGSSDRAGSGDTNQTSSTQAVPPSTTSTTAAAPAPETTVMPPSTAASTTMPAPEPTAPAPSAPATRADIDRIAAGYTWDDASGTTLRYVVEDASAYDPNAALSAVTTVIEGGTGSSPMRVLFFHDGQFVGTDWSTFRVGVSIRDFSDDAVTIVYPHWGPGDSTADPSLAPWVVTFRWEGGKVVPSETVPEDQG